MIKILTFYSLIVSSSALAEPTYYTGLFSKTALKGYDVVSYFQSNQALKGDSKFSFEFQGVIWKFVNEKNLSTFKSDPIRYIPQYGGWCAYAMADGKKVGVDPRSFNIKKGKLYLNYNKKVQNKWQKKQDQYISKADKYWEKI